jgi:hypothetical protein
MGTHERYECRDLAFVGRCTPEAVEDEFLERFNLVLQGHEVHDGFVSTISTLLRGYPNPGLTLHSGHRYS